MKIRAAVRKEYAASSSATSGLTAYSGKEDRKTRIKARRNPGAQTSRIRAVTRQIAS